jgi:DNA (cytosine-5)-methyltransferase 1
MQHDLALTDGEFVASNYASDQNRQPPDNATPIVDDQVYADSRSVVWTGGKPKALGAFKRRANAPAIVSFFTGCGGVDLGFEAIGCTHVAAFEFNEIFCKTLRHNRPQWKVYGPPSHSGDMSKHDEIVTALRKHCAVPFDGIFVGGPPCQPFSIAANQRFSKSGDNFKRVGFAHGKNGNLLFDYVDVIIAFQPKAFLIENVPGVRDIDGGKQLQEAYDQLRAAGYTIHEPLVVNAADYGIPQNRNRLFVVGSRTGKAFVPPVTSEVKFGCGSVLNAIPTGVANHDVRSHLPSSLARYRTLPYGGRDQLGRVDRLDPSLPSKTVIAGGLNGGGRSHLHPEIPRTLSARECARLQTFPDDYVFVGPTARQFTQIGNAVPPVLAAQMGEAIIDSFFADIAD